MIPPTRSRENQPPGGDGLTAQEAAQVRKEALEAALRHHRMDWAVPEVHSLAVCESRRLGGSESTEAEGRLKEVVLEDLVLSATEATPWRRRAAGTRPCWSWAAEE